MKKKIISLLTTLVMVVGLVGVMPVVSVGASSIDVSTAMNYTLNTTKSGTISKANRQDIYKFTILSSGKVNINFNGSMERIYLRVYNLSGEQLGSEYFNWDKTLEQIIVADDIELVKGSYYFIVDAPNTASTYNGSYNFKLSLTKSNESFVETESNNDNSMATANKISLNTTYKGQIAANEKRDFFKFSISSTRQLNISFTGYMKGIYIKIYNNSGEQVFKEYESWSYNTGKITLSESVNLTKGSYYFVVEKGLDSLTSSDYDGNYSFSISISVGKVSGFKTSSISSTAVKLTWNKVSNAQGYIVYKYDNSKKTWVRVAKTTTTANTYTVSKLSSGISYKFAVKAYETVGGKEVTSSTFPTVTAITLMPAATGFKTSSVSSTAVKLTWNKVSGATGYIVYKYDTSKKTYVRVKKTTTNTASYTVTGLSSGTSYKFAVKPYKTVSGKEVTSSSFPTVTAITKLPTVVNGTPTVGKNSVKLTWKKTTGAAGYIVYKYDNSKKTWVRVAKTSSLNYTVKNLKSNTSYKFTVKAYKTVSGKEITSASFTPVSVKTKK